MFVAMIEFCCSDVVFSVFFSQWDLSTISYRRRSTGMSNASKIFRKQKNLHNRHYPPLRFSTIFNQILTLEDGNHERQDDRQGKMLIHTEYSLLSLLKTQDGVIHHHGLFKVKKLGSGQFHLYYRKWRSVLWNLYVPKLPWITNWTNPFNVL